MTNRASTRPVPRWAAACAVGVMAAAGWLHTASATSFRAAQPVPRPSSPATAPMMTMALTGDSIITRKLSVHTRPEFVRMIDLLRSADAAFTNLEMLFHDFEPYPSTESGGTYMRADPALARDLA